MADLVYSFIQNYQHPLDGDMAAIILPGPGYSQVLQDPFGWTAFTQHLHYGAPNRFFAHALLSGYFKQVPLWLQSFLTPVSSVYAAAALFKTFTQLLLLYILVRYVRASRYLQSDTAYWLSALLFIPLFQGAGYNAQMGFIDHSVTYTCFYAFPLALLLGWLLPFYRSLLGSGHTFSVAQTVLWAGAAVVLAFNGPTVPAAMLVVGLLLIIYALRALIQGQTIAAVTKQVGGGQAVGLLLWFGTLCLYSLYIGTFNNENVAEGPDLWQRYHLLPLGVFYQISGKLGIPLLLLFCLMNAWLLKRYFPQNTAAIHLRAVLRWTAWFAVAYILLLPFGGYRVYRPYLLRRDTALPILLALAAFYGISSYFLAQQLAGCSRRWYVGGVVFFCFIFMNADKVHMVGDNACERTALAQLAQSTTRLEHLSTDCTVLAWEKITDPTESQLPAELLYLWRITPRVVLYDQPK